MDSDLPFNERSELTDEPKTTLPNFFNNDVSQTKEMVMIFVICVGVIIITAGSGILYIILAKKEMKPLDEDHADMKSKLSLALKMSEKVSGKMSVFSKKESKEIINQMRALKNRTRSGKHSSGKMKKATSDNAKIKASKKINVKRARSESVSEPPNKQNGDENEDAIKQKATDLLHNKEFIVEYEAHQQRVNKKMQNLLTPFSQRKENETKKSPSISEDKLAENFRNRLDSKPNLDIPRLSF